MKRISYLILFGFFLFGCATQKVRPPGLTEPETSPPPEVIDPEKQAEIIEPKKSVNRVTLVLGGAGVASFATVGILKALEQEKIEVERIVVTGWPSIFAFGYGVLKSIHDLEWFALRLEQSDFYKKGLFDLNRGYHSLNSIEQRLKKVFESKDLRQSRTPIHVLTTETRRFRNEEFDEGEWKNALLRAISAPGIYETYPPKASSAGFLSLDGVNVARAKELGGETILAFAMYEDYIRFLSKETETSESLFRQIFASQLKTRYLEQLQLTPYAGRIHLSRQPNDFQAKRAAIHAGYKSARRLLQQLE